MSPMAPGRTGQSLLAALLTFTLLTPPHSATAEIGVACDRFGRLVGVGWGDGYHACESSGLRIGADLPPRSYAHRRDHRHPRLARAAAGLGRTTATFYDRFDAARRRDHGAGDSCCDHLAASSDDRPVMVIDGSEVILGQSPAAEVIAGRSSQAAETLASAAVTDSPPPPPVTDLPLPSPQPSRLPAFSETPFAIVPAHPGFDPPSRTDRLRLAALGENFRMPPRPEKSESEKPCPANRTVGLPVAAATETEQQVAYPRATVELARRRPASDSQFVTQPR